jgi:hypothetical protein
MTLTLLEDRLAVLREIAGIEHDVILFEHQTGRTADSDDLLRRLATVRLLVLEQLHHYVLLTGDITEMRH